MCWQEWWGVEGEEEVGDGVVDEGGGGSPAGGGRG